MSCTINGTPLSQYTIVYGRVDELIGIHNRERERDADGNVIDPMRFYKWDCLRDAAGLRDATIAAYGITLPVINDGWSEVEYEILLSGAERPGFESVEDLPEPGPMRAVFAVRGKKIVCRTACNTAMRNSGKALGRYFLENPNLSLKDGDILDLSCLDIDTFPRADGTNLRVVTTNIAATYNWGGYSEIDIAHRKNIFLAEIDALDPDVAAVQEADEKWHEVLATLTDYAVVCPTTTILDGEEHANLTTIIYKKSKYTEIACGCRPFDNLLEENGLYAKNAYIRNMTWVVLEDKQTGARALFTNSHWDWKRAPYTDKDGTTYAIIQDFQGKQYGEWTREIATEYGCPAFGMADYNCSDVTSLAFKLYLENGGLTNTRNIALAKGVMRNNTGSTHRPFDYCVQPPHSACDQIVCTVDPRVDILAYRTIVENSEMDLSDHVPRYVDVKLTK